MSDQIEKIEEAFAKIIRNQQDPNTDPHFSVTYSIWEATHNQNPDHIVGAIKNISPALFFTMINGRDPSEAAPSDNEALCAALLKLVHPHTNDEQINQLVYDEGSIARLNPEEIFHRHLLTATKAITSVSNIQIKDVFALAQSSAPEITLMSQKSQTTEEHIRIAHEILETGFSSDDFKNIAHPETPLHQQETLLAFAQTAQMLLARSKNPMLIAEHTDDEVQLPTLLASDLLDDETYKSQSAALTQKFNDLSDEAKQLLTLPNKSRQQVINQMQHQLIEKHSLTL